MAGKLCWLASNLSASEIHPTRGLHFFRDCAIM